MGKAPGVIEAVHRDYGERFGRSYGFLESYRTEDADTILVTAGTIGSTARVAIDCQREKGKRVGLVRIRLFRPFPKVQCIEALRHAHRIVVIDRNISLGQEGIFCEELKSALYNSGARVPVFGFVMGLGGTNVSPHHIIQALDHAEKLGEPPPGPILDGFS
jgi:pyruvate/2-oxoacid:ferredoxin oxidoreductase alpha subunit